MHVISRRTIEEAKQLYPNSSAWLDAWWANATQAAWTRLMEVRETYRDADEVGQCLIFDACGNDYRLICGVTYANQWTRGTLFVKYFLTHGEYDKKLWCKDCAPPDQPSKARKKKAEGK